VAFRAWCARIDANGPDFDGCHDKAFAFCSRLALYVQTNMMRQTSDQSQSETAQSKPRGRFTGQRLKLIRPEIYREAVELLAEPREHTPYDHICRLPHVSEHTLKAIEKAESLSIAERKQRLLDKALRIASKAADRVEDQIEGANITQASVCVWRDNGESTVVARGNRRRSTAADQRAGCAAVRASVTRETERLGKRDRSKATTK
jgi:hypothetical protein